MASVETGILTDDIWILLAQKYLDTASASNVSLTCPALRHYTLPVLFKKITFTGSHRFLHSSIRVIKHLARSKRRIVGLLTSPHLSQNIHHVELRRWLVSQWCWPRDGNPKYWNNIRRYNLTQWSSVFCEVLTLVNMLPNLERITFLELFNRDHDLGYPTQLTDIPTPISWHNSVEFSTANNSITIGPRFAIEAFQGSTPSWHSGWTWKYFQTVLQSTSIPVISLRLCGDIIYHLNQNSEIALDGVEQMWIMALWLAPPADAWPSIHAMFKAPNKHLSSLRDFAISYDENMQRHEDYASQMNEIIRSVGLPSVTSYHGPAEILKDHIEHWKLSSVGFEDRSWSSIAEHIAVIPRNYMEGVTTLDLSTVFGLDLATAAQIWPNIEHLGLSSISTGHQQDQFKEVLQTIAPFSHLKTVLVRGYIRPLGLVPTSQMQLFHPISSLQEITFDGVIKYSWDIRIGWMIEYLSSLVESDHIIAEEEEMETRKVIDEFVEMHSIHIPNISGDERDVSRRRTSVGGWSLAGRRLSRIFQRGE
ncbi:hypothetical protein M422DRAFT_25812 [Sphaerobolus stellatus SS14]|nr:hypothetical protein M422DRAFT_25812 [Sphaerobolus stellatus SS14]